MTLASGDTAVENSDERWGNDMLGVQNARYALLAVAAMIGAALGVFSGTSPAQAQGPASRFCPQVSGLPAPMLVNGFCVFNVGPVTPDQCPPGYGPVSFGNVAGCGGASTTAFSTQILTSLSQAISQEATDIVNERVRQRRDRDRYRTLEQFAAMASPAYAADLPGRRAPVTQAEPAAASPRPALWAQVFGDYERRETAQTVSLAQRTQVIDNTSTTRTGGFVGGADILFSNVLQASDGVLLGLNAVAADSTVRTRTGSSLQRLSTRSIGAYGAYVIGGFSLGLTAKRDFVTLNQSSSDFLNSAPFPPVFSQFKANGHNDNVGGTLSYRFDVGATNWYVEPTVGLDYTRSTWENGAEFGLSNGSTLRARAGANIGTTIIVSDTFAVAPSFGAFAFSNVRVRQGGSSISLDFNNLQPVQTDEGKLRGQVEAGLNMIFASGLSVNARVEYRFAEDLRGAAARLGIRYQF